MKLTVAFALDTYIRGHYTWIHNQYSFLDDVDVIILANMFNRDRINFNLDGHKLFVFPGLEVLESPPLCTILYRRLLRFFLIDSRVDLFIFYNKLKKIKCSLIHAHFSYIGWKYLTIAKILKIPIIVSFYGYDYDFLPNNYPKWKRRYRKLFQRASMFLAEGEYGRQRLIDKGACPHRVKVNHLGIDTDVIPFKCRHLANGEILRLVMVAGYVEKKGHNILIEMMKMIREHGFINNISLTLIGNGPIKFDIVKLVHNYNLDKFVKFINYIPYNTLHSELLKYHLFIHPSRTASDGDCEGGAPVVLLDAQATGLPVISTFHCDIPEEVIHQKTGLLVPENDAIKLGMAVLEFINKPELLSKYGSAARRHVIKNYSARKQARKLSVIYDELVREYNG